MRNLIILLITAFSFQFMIAQEYKETKKYSIQNTVKTKQQEYATAIFDIVTTRESSEKVATLNIVDLDFLEDISISTLTNPNLENIKEILKVDINYNTCCSYTETHYFMVTDLDEFISLPLIENIYCENTISEIKYVFPSQENGKENVILKTTINFTEEFTVKNIKFSESIVWNDDDFLTINDIIDEYYDEKY